MSRFLSKRINPRGFTPPSGRALGNERRIAALAELVATIGLALSTLVAVTVVSVGIARAHGIAAVTGNGGHPFVLPLLIGLILFGLGGYSIRAPRSGQPR
jgi:hypothetical protein